MGAYYSLESLPDDRFDGFPGHVKVAFFECQRARAALRLYERRGWNASAVRFQIDRAEKRLTRVLDDWAFSEENPTLF